MSRRFVRLPNGFEGLLATDPAGRSLFLSPDGEVIALVQHERLEFPQDTRHLGEDAVEALGTFLRLSRSPAQRAVLDVASVSIAVAFDRDGETYVVRGSSAQSAEEAAGEAEDDFPGTSPCRVVHLTVDVPLAIQCGASTDQETAA